MSLFAAADWSWRSGDSCGTEMQRWSAGDEPHTTVGFHADRQAERVRTPHRRQKAWTAPDF